MCYSLCECEDGREGGRREKNGRGGVGGEGRCTYAMEAEKSHATHAYASVTDPRIQYLHRDESHRP